MFAGAHEYRESARKEKQVGENVTELEGILSYRESNGNRGEEKERFRSMEKFVCARTRSPCYVTLMIKMLENGGARTRVLYERT